MINIYISNYHDVYKNIAIERYLFEHAKDELILFLWSNNPCVVFGRNQNIYNEVNLDYASKNHIDVIRRFSGGGAVYQDLGNLNYTFILKDGNDIEKINALLVKVFKNLGLNVYFSGRNDLLINDKKFSGIAYCNDFDHIMYHGTCLVDVNLDNLSNVLKPHDYKLKSHSVTSYRSRVVNLKEIKDINNENIIDSFIKILKDESKIKIIDDIKLNDDIKAIYDLLKDEKYIFNDCPSYSYLFDIRLNNANYHFKIQYQDGLISDVNAYSDDLDVHKIDFYIKSIKNKDISIKNIKEYLLSL